MVMGDKRPKTEKLKWKEITITENYKKLNQKSCNAVRVSVKSARRYECRTLF